MANNRVLFAFNSFFLASFYSADLGGIGLLALADAAAGYIATTTFYSEFIRLGYQASSDLKAFKWNYEKKVNALRDPAARETLEQVIAEAFSIFIPTDPAARETLEQVMAEAFSKSGVYL
ncbi:hypothetical protein Tco_0593415 [Tanacetum coccineum]